MTIAISRPQTHRHDSGTGGADRTQMAPCGDAGIPAEQVLSQMAQGLAAKRISRLYRKRIERPESSFLQSATAAAIRSIPIRRRR